MDRTTALGILLGIAALVGGYYLEGGSILSLWGISAFIIVIGGTLAATFASFRWEDITRVPSLLNKAFADKKNIDKEATIAKLVELSTTARREGLLALEEQLESIDDPFFRKGLELVIDGVESELIKQIMELELTIQEERDERGARIFETAGGFAPTLGIIGTVMGLVLVLSNLNEPSQLGQAIAVAFLATLYGIFSANIFFLPIANKLKEKAREEVLYREMLVEGILSIQAGENPHNMQQKLQAFLIGEKKRSDSREEAIAAEQEMSL